MKRHADRPRDRDDLEHQALGFEIGGNEHALGRGIGGPKGSDDPCDLALGQGGVRRA